jgi:hypothetical protein
MSEIKKAFLKVKHDIENINKELDFLKQELFKTQKQILEMKDFFVNQPFQNPKKEEFRNIDSPTDNLINSTFPTHIPTDKHIFKPLKPQNLPFSTGNGGVPTDRQTDRQTNQQTEKRYFGDAFEILDSLDNIKKEIRNKFKRITDKEFLVFSTIYQLEEEDNFVDYKSVSNRLKLTESSIRDYVGRLIKKGIPVEKTKINNKLIQLSISDKLRKITPLPIILQLREL